ncbi:MAG TPA: GTP 3',8-cyclase MoaA [Terriglobia bacterium]|nr:GTP 3',8-cyclase MoaA [Terriglobia bacterium]
MLLDTLKRPVKDLRISVTDRCNFRCTYCMPFEEYDEWIDRHELLTYEEIVRVAAIFLGLGVEKIRLTGGEPLVRKDLEKLIAELSPLPGLRDLCLTTNGALLAQKSPGLKAAGLNRINVSLDSLDPEKFKRITQRGDLAAVLEGLEAAQQAGFERIKINAVIERGVNDDEILPLVEFARANRFAVRFIEFMDVGNSNSWTAGKVVSKKEIVEKIAARYPLVKVGREEGSAPSVDYRFADGAGDIGVIASVTEPFWSDCTRARITADGKIVTCLFSQTGHDIKGMIRGGATDEELQDKITSIWRARADRYFEERLEAMRSAGGYQAKAHRKLEMIVLGG